MQIKDEKKNLPKVHNTKRISGGKNISVKLGICRSFPNTDTEEFPAKVSGIWQPNTKTEGTIIILCSPTDIALLSLHAEI